MKIKASCTSIPSTQKVPLLPEIITLVNNGFGTLLMNIYYHQKTENNIFSLFFHLILQE